MKRLRGKLAGVMVCLLITPLTLAGCSKTTEVKENVSVNPDNTTHTVHTVEVTKPDKDVNVNVDVQARNPVSQPQVIEKKITVNETHVTQPVQPEKKIVVNNNIITPANTAQTKEVTVTTDNANNTVTTDVAQQEQSN